MGWLSEWSYRKIVSITGQTGAGTDYQVDFSIGDGSGGDFNLESHCTSFPNDIRVTDNDQTTLLDHWVEDLTVDPIIMWAEVADDLGSNADICFYYGKSGESSVSTFSSTFISGDEFEGGIGNWVEDGSLIGGSVFSESSVIKIGSKSTKHTRDSAASAFFNPVGTINSNVAVEFYRRVTGTGFETYTELNQGQVHDGTKQVTLLSFYSDANIKYHDGSWNTLMAYSTNTWYRFKLCKFDFTAHTFDIYVDGVIKKSGAAFRNNLSYFDNFEIHISNVVAATSYIDMLLVRKHLSPSEPAFSSAGSEESAGATIIPVFMHSYRNLREA